MPATIALAPAPREVPLSLRLRVMGSGIWQLIGWIFFGIGLVLSSVFLRLSEPLFGDPFAGPTSTIEGTVVEVETTSTEVNGRHVLAVHYEYPLGDGKQRGTSYTSDSIPSTGATVPVEIVRGSPTTSRIRGMRTALFPKFTAFVLLFPLIGAVFLLLGLWGGWRRAGLLQNGQLAYGRLVDSQPTNTKVNNQRVYKLTFTFVDAAKKERQAVVRTHHLQSVTDETEETLLYDPNGPTTLLWDSLPSRPELDGTGRFLPVGVGGLLPVLLPPTLIVIGMTVVGWLFGAPS